MRRFLIPTSSTTLSKSDLNQIQERMVTSSLFFYLIPARQIGDLANKAVGSLNYLQNGRFTHQDSDVEPLPGFHAEFSNSHCSIGAPVELMLLKIRLKKKERDKEKLSFKSCFPFAPGSWYNRSADGPFPFEMATRKHSGWHSRTARPEANSHPSAGIIKAIPNRRQRRLPHSRPVTGISALPESALPWSHKCGVRDTPADKFPATTDRTKPRPGSVAGTA